MSIGLLFAEWQIELLISVLLTCIFKWRTLEHGYFVSHLLHYFIMSAPPSPPPPPKSRNKDDQKNKGKVTQVKKVMNRPKQVVKEKAAAAKKSPAKLTFGSSPSALTDLPSTEVQSLKLEKSQLQPVDSEIFEWREPGKQKPQNKLGR